MASAEPSRKAGYGRHVSEPPAALGGGGRPRLGPRLEGALRAAVGEGHLLTDPDLTASYERDWTGRYGGPAAAVVRPGTTDEVAAVLRVLSAESVAVVPQGGNTGLVGGGVPRAGEVVLSLRRLRGDVHVDPEDRLLEAGAGTTLAEAQQAAREVGLEVGLDLAARDAATLGGMVATNAGGVRVVRHGPLRRRLAGLEAVLADGTVVDRRGGLLKDNVGYDLPGLFAGSEGTLAVVTRVLLRLEPLPASRVAAFVALRAPEALGTPGAGRATATALQVGREILRLGGIEVLEVVYPPGVRLVCEHAGLPAPPDPGADAWLLVEATGDDEVTTARLGALLDAHPLVSATAVALDAPGRAALFAYRERHTEAIARLGVAHKLDVAVPLSRLARLAAEVVDAVAARWPDAATVLFGHLGDGNLHVNVVGPPPDDDEVDALVLGIVLAHGGSVSAEHGVGVARLPFVSRARHPGDLAAMRAVKRALDPRGVLNPGVLIPAG